jgi:hypothetical protein
MAERTPEEIKESILKQLNSPIVEALDNEGITPSYLAKLLKKELHAKQIKVFQHQGEVIMSEPLDALDIQQKARQDAHKLLDHYPAERHKIEQLAPITIILDVPDEVEGELEADET